jgi:DNA-binding GntR family transcriptional regulator
MATASPHLEPALRDGSVPGTLAERAYLRLREEIIRGDLAPGALVREEDVAERFQIGRTPVREAVQRLRHEGYLTILPRRGTLVSEISITDLAAIYEIRARMESWAARLAAERAGPEDRQEAEQLIAELQSQLTGDDYESLLATDRRIHRFVYRCSKNTFLAETLDHYHNFSLRILHVAMRRYPTLTPRLDEVVHEQQAVLEAICRGDGDTAERIAVEHIRGFEQHIRQVI